MQTSNNHLAAIVNSKSSSSGMWIVAFGVVYCCCWVMDLWLSQSQPLIVAVAVVGVAAVFLLIDCWLLQLWIVVVAVVDCGCCGHWIVAVPVIGLWLLRLLDCHCCGCWIVGCCGHWIVAVMVADWWLLWLLDCGCHSC